MIVFEWDPGKNEINIRKYKVSFEEASVVFYDGEAIVFDDPDHSDESEEKFIIMGVSNKANMLMVCHCYRNRDRIIRIISARKATKSEEKDYIEIKKVW